MNLNRITILSIGFVASLLSGLVGCASNRVDLEKEGRVSVKVIHPENMTMPSVQIFQQGEDLVIFGRIHRNTQFSCRSSRHIDAVILGPDGKCLYDAKPQNYFDHFPGESDYTLSFKVHLPICPPPGSTVVVAYHANTYSNKVTSECRGNLDLTPWARHKLACAANRSYK